MSATCRKPSAKPGGERAMERVKSRYSWDAVTDAYEKLLTGLNAG